MGSRTPAIARRYRWYLLLVVLLGLAVSGKVQARRLKSTLDDLTTCSFADAFSGCDKVLGNCFPGDAMVTTPSGAKKMSLLKVGDKVLTDITQEGDMVFEEVYMFGHKDPTPVVNFVRVDTSHNATLRLTPDHFVPVKRAKGGGRLREIPASQVKVGDTILVHVTDDDGMHGGVGKQSLRESRVTRVELTADQGLFNPYTMSGNIVVDNVVASCHSSSFLDSAMNMLGIHIPQGYQVVFAPIRATYRLLGAKNFHGIEYVIDRVADFVNGDRAPTGSGSSTIAAAGLAGWRHQSL